VAVLFLWKRYYPEAHHTKFHIHNRLPLSLLFVYSSSVANALYDTALGKTRARDAKAMARMHSTAVFFALFLLMECR
jgi:hypothetical protein